MMLFLFTAIVVSFVTSKIQLPELNSNLNIHNIEDVRCSLLLLCERQIGLHIGWQYVHIGVGMTGWTLYFNFYFPNNFYSLYTVRFGHSALGCYDCGPTIFVCNAVDSYTNTIPNHYYQQYSEGTNVPHSFPSVSLYLPRVQNHFSNNIETFRINSFQLRLPYSILLLLLFQVELYAMGFIICAVIPFPLSLYSYSTQYRIVYLPELHRVL